MTRREDVSWPVLPSTPTIPVLVDPGLTGAWVAVGGALAPLSAANPYGAPGAAAVFTEDASVGQHGVSFTFHAVQGTRYRVFVEVGNPAGRAVKLAGLVGVSGVFDIFTLPANGYLGVYLGYFSPSGPGSFPPGFSQGFTTFNGGGDECLTIPPTYGRVAFDVIAPSTGAASFDIRNLLDNDANNPTNFSYLGDGVSTITLYNARIYEIQDY